MSIEPSGSSPLTRGKPYGTRLAVHRHRLIPAHAGKTGRHAYSPPNTGAHPRSRGENAQRDFDRAQRDGSSPLTRGKLGLLCFQFTRGGLIPAHAGKTCRRHNAYGRHAAHPRSRGENRSDRLLDPLNGGSSPLTRGKRVEALDVVVPRRLIPAHAGKTHCVSVEQVMSWAHPRSRGENSSPRTHTTPVCGSSPLTRGKHSVPRKENIGVRLIPAHAGKTSRCDTRHEASRAHPRSRGENSIRPKLASLRVGSSPLTRGKLATLTKHK